MTLSRSCAVACAETNATNTPTAQNRSAARRLDSKPGAGMHMICAMMCSERRVLSCAGIEQRVDDLFKRGIDGVQSSHRGPAANRLDDFRQILFLHARVPIFLRMNDDIRTKIAAAKTDVGLHFGVDAF